MYVYFGSYLGVKGNILELFGAVFLYLVSGSVTALSSTNKEKLKQANKKQIS